MAKPKKKDKPWWGIGDSLWGGETFESKETKPLIGVVAGDKFRVEKGPKNTTLVPHPKNTGTWKDSHSKRKPIVLSGRVRTRNLRAFKIMVKITKGSNPTPLFLIERKNRTIALSDDVNDPGSSGGTASVER